nr:unnamed protein product [Spirometra erinaceieuropaei]
MIDKNLSYDVLYQHERCIGVRQALLEVRAYNKCRDTDLGRKIKCWIVKASSQMRLFCILLLIGTCFGNIYRVGENRTFSAFEIRPPIKKVIASPHPIKFGDCGLRDFCLQTFNASRAALINGVVTEPVFAAVFYLSQCATPQALVVNKKGAPKQELNLPNGTVIHTSLDVEVGSILYYLLVFDKDIETRLRSVVETLSLLPVT